MRLIYRQGNYGSVCFPYKESCSFATTQCLAQCSEKFNDQAWFKEIFAFFKANDAVRIYCRLRDELSDCKFDFLSWFDSGDCTPGLVQKLVSVITCLSDDGIQQIGFTRNEKLWQKVKDISHVRFIYTIPRGTKIRTYGYYAVPNFKKQRICIVNFHEFSVPMNEDIDDVIKSGNAFLRFCGGGCSYVRMQRVTRPEEIAKCSWSASNVGTISDMQSGEIYETNCKYCFDEERGCFADG